MEQTKNTTLRHHPLFSPRNNISAVKLDFSNQRRNFFSISNRQAVNSKVKSFGLTSTRPFSPACNTNNPLRGMEKSMKGEFDIKSESTLEV